MSEAPCSRCGVEARAYGGNWGRECWAAHGRSIRKALRELYRNDPAYREGRLASCRASYERHKARRIATVMAYRARPENAERILEWRRRHALRVAGRV